MPVTVTEVLELQDQLRVMCYVQGTCDVIIVVCDAGSGAAEGVLEEGFEVGIGNTVLDALDVFVHCEMLEGVDDRVRDTLFMFMFTPCWDDGEAEKWFLLLLLTG